jgi:hypothetical protein
MTRQEPSGEISRRRWTRRLLRRSAVISALAVTLIGCGKGDSDSGVAPVNRSGDYAVSLDAPTGNLLSGRMRISPDGVVTITMDLQPWVALTGSIDPAGFVRVTGDTLPNGTLTHAETWSGQLLGTGVNAKITDGVMLYSATPGVEYAWTADCVATC